MIVVHRYPLEPWDRGIKIPQGAKILHVRERLDRIDMWAEVDDAARMAYRRVHMVMTGETPPTDAEYIGTAIVDKQKIVVHVYIGEEREE